MVPEPPSNGEYLVAAYAVTTVLLVGYWVRLWRMGRTLSGKEKLKR